MSNVRTKAIEVIVLIALAVVAQIIVGSLGQVTTGVLSSLSVAPTFALSGFTGGGAGNTIGAYNDMGANSISITLSGSYAWISSSYPVVVTVTGNAINTYGTGGVGGAPTNTVAQSKSFTLTNSTTTQTVCSSCGTFWNFSGVTVTGLNAQAIPSIGVQVTQNFNSISGGVGRANTISVTDTGTVAATTGVNNFNVAGVSVTTVLNFMSVIFLIAAVVILLSMFGMENLFKLGQGGRGN